MSKDQQQYKDVESAIIRIDGEGKALIKLFLDDGNAIVGEWESAVKYNKARPNESFSGTFAVYKIDCKDGELRIYLCRHPNVMR